MVINCLQNAADLKNYVFFCMATFTLLTLIWRKGDWPNFILKIFFTIMMLVSAKFFFSM